jgi:hypothetical protein
MSLSDHFTTFLANLKIDNDDTISLRYGEITGALNSEFRNTVSKTANNLQVGSYGRWTAIRGISDLDMLYIMPASAWDNFKSSGQYKLLSKTCSAISARYPKTEVFVDRLVVRALYTDFHVEVQPVFENEDGSFTYPDTKNEGSWKVTKPRPEIVAASKMDSDKNKSYRHLCKMVRAWKNRHGVGMGGLLLDTLVYNFFSSTSAYDNVGHDQYGQMAHDFFKYIGHEPDQDYYAALGSGQRVAVKKKFQRKARKARDLCEKALTAVTDDEMQKRWRKVFGRPFPLPEVAVKKAYISEGSYQALDTEEFIEDRFPVDVRYNIRIDCNVTQKGFMTHLLRDMLSKKLPLLASKSLEFKVVDHNVPKDFVLYWKVLNRGAEAIKRDSIRGQIVADAGHLQKSETTTFKGDHVVDCYAVLRGVVVARDRIHVPIQG